MMRARYGTGDFLKLIKRECNIRIRLTPLDCDFLRVHLRIGSDNHYFYPSCIMGSQFFAFLSAVYNLYEEPDLRHVYFGKSFNEKRGIFQEYPHSRDDGMYKITTSVHWDEEGSIDNITFVRHCPSIEPCEPGIPDPILIHIEGSGPRERSDYTVDGRDLCYAIAKGCTEALKKYGFMGYKKSTGMQSPGDSFNITQLLFIKAYALNAMEVRETKELWRVPHGWERADASNFEKELELLLFDM